MTVQDELEVPCLAESSLSPDEESTGALLLQDMRRAEVVKVLDGNFTLEKPATYSPQATGGGVGSVR